LEDIKISDTTFSDLVGGVVILLHRDTWWRGRLESIHGCGEWLILKISADRRKGDSNGNVEFGEYPGVHKLENRSEKWFGEKTYFGSPTPLLSSTAGLFSFILTLVIAAADI
jgi:hypothetical protein